MSEQTVEYKIIRGQDKDIQMQLNTWRHQYEIEVLSAVPWTAGHTYLVVRRTPK